MKNGPQQWQRDSSSHNQKLSWQVDPPTRSKANTVLTKEHLHSRFEPSVTARETCSTAMAMSCTYGEQLNACANDAQRFLQAETEMG